MFVSVFFDVQICVIFSARKATRHKEGFIKMTSKDALSIDPDVKPHVLFKGEYEQWKDRFLDFIDKHANGENIMLSITEGPMKSRYKADKQARSLLLQSIPNEIYIKIDGYKANAKKMWDQLQKMMMESKVGNQMKVANCINSYEEFKGEKRKRRRKKKKVLTSSESESESESDGDDGESLKQAMLLLTRAFQKKFYKKPGSNSQRYSSSSSKNHEHRERVEGRRYEENRYVEKKPDERKKFNKLLLAKQQEAGIALMAEDEFWLDHSEGEDEEKEEIAHLCLMGKEVKYDESDDETADEVLNLTEKDFVTKMEAMMVELNDLQVKLKKEKDRVAKRNSKIFELNKSVIGNKDLIDSLRKSGSDSKSKVDFFEKKIYDFEVKVSKYEFEKKESALIVHKLQVENKLLNKKVNGLEAKLYARGQTDQTIFLNAPDEEADVKEKWGLGFKNPHYLKKAIRK
ncbi:hypothetical protein L6452_22152 [Arctium lappa]|uniref:Uncharacterized protein n=1 Tax=Arctium lappa TaxID=4217 RepID=A0ACB9AZA0_ARCLA|nr:hypothetical protein L6452_22152 [Arctium lappa]